MYKRYGATGVITKYRFTFNKAFLKLTNNYLLGNYYFTLVSVCFCPLIGISIGFDPDPFMATYFCIIMKVSGLQKATIFFKYF